MSDDTRTDFLLDVMREAFADLVAADPSAFRKKFRTMAAEPFAFYRGTACVFYADMAGTDDQWSDERTGRVWIQGDLHAENFGTYMDGNGVLVFDSTTSTRPTSGRSPGTSGASWRAWP